MPLTSYAKSIAELAKAGAAKAKKQGILGDCGKMCDTCAFRWNQPHTLNYFLAADNAAEMLIHGGDFNCHTWDFKDSDHECVGFKFAKLVFTPDPPTE